MIVRHFFALLLCLPGIYTAVRTFPGAMAELREMRDCIRSWKEKKK